MMKLVEVIRTNETEPEVFDKAYAWVGEIGKVPVSCGDTPVSDDRFRNWNSALISPMMLTCHFLHRVLS